jgi:alanyl-tRNA synthetase
LRFDFSHFSPVTAEQVDTIEDLVNGWVRENSESVTKVMNLADAKAAGAVALFGEKYGDSVRVVTVHPESTELCGGTHVRRSGDIQLFKITQESSIASGVRRIVAVTGQAAIQTSRAFEKQLRTAADLFKATPADLPKRIESTQKLLKELEKKIEVLQVKAQSGGSGGAGAAGENIQDINGIKVLTRLIDEADANLLKQLSDKFREQFKSGIIGLGGKTADGKAVILVTASDDVVKQGFKSGDAMRLMATEVGGKGGGKPESAQGGGVDPSKIPAAFEKLFELVRSR